MSFQIKILIVLFFFFIYFKKRHFSEYNYYESIINDKIELLGSYSQLIPPNCDYSEITMKIERIKELLNVIIISLLFLF